MYFFYFFKDFIYLFDREKSQVDGEAGREREREAGSLLMRDLIPGPWDHDLSWRQQLNPLSHPGAQSSTFLKVGITDWVVRGMNRENEDFFSFCPFSFSALLDASELVIYWGVREGKATLPLLGVTGIASKRSMVLALNQKYLNATFVRESNPQCMCHFAFFLRYPASASVSQMPWRVQYAVIFISFSIG